MRGAAIALAITAISHGALAATRTVSFVGLSVASTTEDETANRASTSDCRIVVVNTGTTSQDILGVTFISYNGQGGSTSTPVTAPLPSNVFADRYDPGGAGSGNDCTPNGTSTSPSAGLQAGAFCVFDIVVSAASSSAQVAPCAGSIQVADTSPTSPGSVVAAGAIATSQEGLLLGGVLSGAMYLSGSHLWSTVGMQAQYGAFGYDQGYNMNVYCAAACNAGTANGQTSFCNSNCGFSGGSDPGGWTHGVSYWGEPAGFHASEQGNGLPPVEPVAANVSTGSPVSGTTNINQGGTVVRSANGHFAGGMVQEMIVGPLISICTANAIAWQKGASDFTHAGGVDGHSWILGNGPYPPERLLCNHRHAMDDLYFGNQSNTPIVINGGTPF
jgi:hypothetical protein